MTQVPPETDRICSVIDEIISSEDSYIQCLEDFRTLYIEKTRPIAMGQLGPEGPEELGLTQQEFEQIFGHRLEGIINHSKEMSAKLGSINLIRSGPMPGGGRVGLVADCFKEAASDLAVYSPYVSSHPSSRHLLQQKMEKVHQLKATKSKKSLFRRSPSSPDLAKHFSALWEVISNSSPSLKGQTLESLLIMPVQRVPRYKMLLEELLKNIESSHPAYELLLETTELYRSAATGINEALRQHEKIVSRLGHGESLRPTGFTTTMGKDSNSKIKITNTY